MYDGSDKLSDTTPLAAAGGKRPCRETGRNIEQHPQHLTNTGHVFNALNSYQQYVDNGNIGAVVAMSRVQITTKLSILSVITIHKLT